MNQSEKIDQLVTALIKAQGTIRGALKDSKNPFFNSKYADLESCWEAVRGPLTTNGLTVIQTMGTSNGAPTLATTLAHSSGQFISGEQLVCAKSSTDPQALGSAITYARRYGLAAIVGLIQVDDDAEAATGRGGRVEPPGEGNGDTTPRGYKVTFGKYVQKSLEELYSDPKVGPNGIASYIDFLEAAAVKKNTPLSGPALEFVERAAEFLGVMENKSIEHMRSGA